jgi:AbrB family looped-hinge helix DNA binding protein
MRATMDKAGRLVIPKTLRDSVGLGPGVVEIVADGTGVHVEPVANEALERHGAWLVIPASGAALDDDLVRSLRAGDRR